MGCYGMLLDIMGCYDTLQEITGCYGTLCDVMGHYRMLQDIMICYGVFWGATGGHTWNPSDPSPVHIGEVASVSAGAVGEAKNVT